MKLRLFLIAAIAAVVVFLAVWVIRNRPEPDIGGKDGPRKLEPVAAETKFERGIADFPALDPQRDWPWWRGPQRNGFADPSAKPPAEWSESQNILWKSPVPGRGHSSPIVVGPRVILTTSDRARQTQSVLAFDRATGQRLWMTEVNQGEFPATIHATNTDASSTAACDGERLFAVFFHHKSVEVVALDLEGKILWKQKAGNFHPRVSEFGYGASPTIYRDTVIVTGEYDSDESFMTALDRKTGEPKWKTRRPPNPSFSTPVVAHLAGRDQLLISGSDQVASYDPATGEKLWSTPGTSTVTCGTMVWSGDIVFASGGYPKNETLAVRADGSAQVLWTNQQKCYEQSLLAFEGYVYGMNEAGILFCWRGEDGQEMWKKRLKGPVSASPVLAGGLVYQSNELGTTYVFRPTHEKFDLVAENRLGEETFATPVFVGGEVFLRTATGAGSDRQEVLYAIGAK